MGENLKKKIIFIIIASIVIVSITVKITLDAQDKQDKQESIRQSEQLILSQLEAADVYIEDKKTLEELKQEGVNISTSKIVSQGCDLKNSYVTNDKNGTYNVNLKCDNYESEKEWGNWSDWTTEKPINTNNNSSNIKKIYQTVILYNYALTTSEWSNWGKWSSWTTNQPIIPAESKDAYDVETKTVYKYSDTLYKFYKSNIVYADGYYSVSNAPASYTKDESSKIVGEWSDWTTSSPKDAQDVEYKTQYRCRDIMYAYFKGSGQNKIYYTDSEGNIVYSLTNIAGYYKDITKYEYTNWSEWSDNMCTPNKQEDSNLFNTRRVYRYRPCQYRYYKETRTYANGYYELAPEGYPIKDESSIKESNWSEELETKPEEKPNRKILKEIYYRVRTREKKYNTKTELPTYLEKEEFEQAVGKSIEELKTDNAVKILTQTKYRYKEAK